MKKMLSVLIIIGLMIPQILICQTSNKAYLTINVNVNGVRIEINKNSYGIASQDEPILDEFSPGSYKIVAIKEGYKKNTKNIILQKGESREITFKLEPADEFEIEKDEDEGILGLEYGSVIIVVRREGKLVPAKVYVDGQYAENAPFTINKLTVGEHDIKAQFKGLEKINTIQIEKNKKIQLDIELVTTSKISLTSNLNGVKANIDNSNYNIPSKIDLIKGTYSFNFSKYGYITAEKDFFINGDSNYRVLVNLSKDYPHISANKIGRKIKNRFTEDDFRKKEYQEKEIKKNSSLSGPLFTVACIVGGLVGFRVAEVSGFFIGVLLSGYTVASLNKPKVITKKIPIKKNIVYNTNILPIDLRKKNKEINEYNKETKRLIKEKQIEKYSKKAIKVYEE